MSNYRLQSSSLTLVDVPSSSNLDEPHVRQTRRGTVHKVLGGINVVQYADQAAVGDTRITWSIPLANANQYGTLYSASIGTYGDSLVWVTPNYGSMNVAFEPGENGFRPTKFHPHTFGYGIEIVFVRL